MNDGADDRRGLGQADFALIASNGFGDGSNSYAHSMAWFNDAAYVGTTRDIFALLKLFPPPNGARLQPWPVAVPDSVEQLDLRAQIWRWDWRAATWSRVHESPLIVGREGRQVPRDLGYRGMAVFQGTSDPAPALYVSALSSVSRGSGARILRSLDGQSFEAVGAPGLGNPEISTFRSLVAFDGHLAVAPVGEGKTWNTTRAPTILRSRDPAGGCWELACDPGFGDANNSGIFELHADERFLYAGTFNHVDGYQVWRAPAAGGGAWIWEQCLARGAERGPANEMAMSFCTFGPALYIGGGIQNGGYDRWRGIGPAACEIVRLNADGDWDLIVGEPRATPAGHKEPLSGHGPGFDNLFAGYLWRMIEHDGWLYASTFDWSQCLAYASDPQGPYKQLRERFGAGQIAREGGGFGLWRSRDGVDWVCVTANGFGNPFNYGARTLLSTPRGLLVGTANPFGPELAVASDDGWDYVANDRGGLEIWLGRAAAPHAAAAARRPRWSFCLGGAADPARSLGARVTPIRRRSVDAGRCALVTGASSELGRLLIGHLVARACRVLALVATTADGARLQRDLGIETRVADLLDPTALEGFVAQADSLYHLDEWTGDGNAKALWGTNVHGTENLLRAWLAGGHARRFVMRGSLRVYADLLRSEAWPLRESSRIGYVLGDRFRDYGLSKIAAERLVWRWARAHGFEPVILRCAASYGARLDGDGLLHRQSHQALDTSPAADPYTDALVSQPIHEADLARAFVLAGATANLGGTVLNIAGAEVVDGRDPRRLLKTGGQSSRQPDQSRIWRRYLRIVETYQAERCIGFYPAISLAEGLLPLSREARPSPPPGF